MCLLGIPALAGPPLGLFLLVYGILLGSDFMAEAGLLLICVGLASFVIWFIFPLDLPRFRR
jgi:hypothetical protein